MYVTSIDIENLRSIRALGWQVPRDRAPGWHVILGSNGSGKSSLLQATSLGLIASGNLYGLREDWSSWIRNGQDECTVRLGLSFDPRFDPAFRSDDVDGFCGTVAVSLSRSGVSVDDKTNLDAGFEPEGCFSMAFGPFCRFSGGSQESEKLEQSNPYLARHLSIFDEGVAFNECLEWLQDLRFKELEGHPGGALLAPLTRFINQEGFLPFAVRLKQVRSSGVRFVDGAGCEVPIEDLSDGYRSILSLTLELLRQLASTYGPDSIFTPENPDVIALPGVVLIDEIDAHLHPSWQRRIGDWFQKRFPNMQFLVATHSPLICQAAAQGSVFVLPQPGSDEMGRMLEGPTLERLVLGNVLEAYGSGAFGNSGARADSAQRMLDRLAELNLREITTGLSNEELQERERLRAVFPAAAHPLARHHAPAP